MATKDDLEKMSPVRLCSTGSVRANFIRFAPWILYLGSAVFLLRPVLLTAIAADDFVNPFTLVFHAGTDVIPIMQRTWNNVSATGHFNYLGQAFGSFNLAIWNYLMANLGIRYSLIYSATKLLTYLISIEITARTVRHALTFVGQTIAVWPLRLLILVAIAFPIQIHIPWSNDPVASYPLSGYLAATIGLVFMLLVFKLISNPRYLSAVLIGLYGACAVLYYEFNSFAVLAVAPMLGVFILSPRKDLLTIRQRLFTSVIVVLPAATTTVYFFLKNRAASMNYSGTSTSFSYPFLKIFAQGIVGALPGSSWNIALDWLPKAVSFQPTYLIQFLTGLVLLTSLFLFRRRWKHTSNHVKVPTSRLLLALSPFVIYWLGATFVQTSTTKIQQESTRIGQVYNFYAVGSLCFAAIVVLVFYQVDWSNLNRFVKTFSFVILFVFGAFQFILNWNVTTHLNGSLTGNRNLLVAFTERPPMPERCAALEIWKSMGWPEYYWLDMELGMNASYEIYHGEKFCEP